MKIFQPFFRALSVLKSLFLSGLFTVLPIAATLFSIHFMYNLVMRALEPLHHIAPPFLHDIPGSQFIIGTLVILLIGSILKVVIAHSILVYGESLVSRIPFVRIVYSSSKTLVDFFKVPTKGSTISKKVVLIPYPKKGQYHLAFLLEPADDNYSKIIPDNFRSYPGQKYCKVFMPNSPNPSSGYFFIMEEDEIIHTNLSFEEALKALVSCGLITPDSLK
jgi:uncharacterized membrane protein